MIKMQVSELKGLKIKRNLRKKGIPVSHVIKRYHNRRKDLTGNFGFTIRIGDGINDIWLTLEGEHDAWGRVIKLELSDYGYSTRFLGKWISVNADTYQEFIEKLAKELHSVLLAFL